MLANPQPPRTHLSKGWHYCIKSAVLHAIALAHSAIVYARAWASDSIHARVRLAAENDRLREECALLREELRIKYSRMAQIAPQRRPHYGPSVCSSPGKVASSTSGLPALVRSLAISVLRNRISCSDRKCSW